jgi:hypothetical protein
MELGLKMLRQNSDFNIAELERRLQIGDGCLVKRWKTERKRIEAETEIEATLRAIDKSPMPNIIKAESATTHLDAAPKQGGFFSGHTVLVIPDLHCPWENVDALAFLKAVKQRYKPDVIVSLGDEVDFYGMSRFTHDPDVANPGAELSEAVKHLIPFYQEFPNVLICQSNHTHRIHKKAADSGLPRESVRSIEEILKTPEGWIYKQCHRVDGVDYKHGTGKSGAQAHINHAKATGRSTCIGHIHAWGGVNYLRRGLFAANFGCLIDRDAPCFAYASEMDDNIVLGCGLVIGGKEAHFIVMHLDENNRWTGNLHG